MAGCRSARTRLPHLRRVRQVDQGAIADYKHLGAVLPMIRDEQLRRRPPPRSGPRRGDQHDASG